MMDRGTQAAAMIRAFNELFPDAGYQYAHVVLGDFNLSEGMIESCQKSFDLWLMEYLRDLPADADEYERLWQYQRAKAAYHFMEVLLALGDDVLEGAANVLLGE